MKISRILLVIASLTLVCVICLTLSTAFAPTPPLRKSAGFEMKRSASYAMDGERALTVFGLQARIVRTSSMERCEQTDVSGYRIKDIRAGSVIFIKTVPKNAERAAAFYGKLEVGDVLTFRYAEYSATPVVITHRIVAIEEKATGGYLISLEGDNKSEGSNVLTQVIDTTQTDSGNAVIGKVIGKNYLLGRVLLFLRGPIGLLALMLIPIILLVFYKKKN